MIDKFSPGPWNATTRKGSWDWVVYCERDPNHEICQMFHDGTEFNELGEANSRLVASAPALLGGCRALLGLLQLLAARSDITPELREHLTNGHRIEEARAAVEAATAQ